MKHYGTNCKTRIVKKSRISKIKILIDIGEFAFEKILLWTIARVFFFEIFFNNKLIKVKIATLIVAIQRSNRALIRRREMSITWLSTNKLSLAKRTMRIYIKWIFRETNVIEFRVNITYWYITCMIIFNT